MSIDILSVENLSFRYHQMEILQEISFHIKAGDYVGLVGPNGSGKSTLIRAILGLVQPVKGAISLFGCGLAEFQDWQRIGYVPQRSHFDSHFPATVREIVSLGLLSKKKFPKKIEEMDEIAIDTALDLMAISEIKNRLMGELSGGQQQRVSIARAIVNQPDLLILDEPTTAIDPDTRERFISFLKGLHQNSHTTIVLVTHDAGTVGKYVSHLMYLDKRLIFHGTLEDFCGSREMSGYFGEVSQHLICHRHD